MQWIKRGIVWRPPGTHPHARTHAMGPTPLLLNDDVIRVFIACLDAGGRGRPFWVDVSAEDPMVVLRSSEDALIDLGSPGSFDDNGVVPLCALRTTPQRLLLYYAGFELCTRVRYRIFTGVAVSKDGGNSFERISRVPVLDRSHDELQFRCGPFAMLDDGRVRLWYIAGSEWTDVDSKSMPVYDLRYLESDDGLRWPPAGKRVLAITDQDEHGFGRPWVIKQGPHNYQLFYSIRRRSLGAYRLGYAESVDGVSWQRKDEEMGLDVTPGTFDSHAIMYSAVISARGRTWCFYNGNDFGRDGFAVAERVG